MELVGNKLTNDEVALIMREVDTDRDGKVSFEGECTVWRLGACVS
jgi:Ca2+-binding EF-hand superfamily protein